MLDLPEMGTGVLGRPERRVPGTVPKGFPKKEGLGVDFLGETLVESIENRGKGGRWVGDGQTCRGRVGCFPPFRTKPCTLNKRFTSIVTAVRQGQPKVSVE